MNENFQEKNLLKSMKINEITNQSNSLNSLQFVSTPNFFDFKKENNKNNNYDNSNNININIQNNGLNNNSLNKSEKELFNFELDQSTESIISNKSISHQILLEYSSNKKNMNGNSNNKNNIQNDIKAKNLFISDDRGNKEEIQKINNKENLKYIELLKNLEEKLKNEYLINKENKNYIEVLKKTINSHLLKNGNINNLDNASKQLNKKEIDILIEYMSFKQENEKIKKQLVMQQILYNDMKNEILNLRQENNELKILSDKLSKENKTLKKIKEEISYRYDKLRVESEEIKNNLSKYEVEFNNCQKNNNEYIRLKTVNSELSINYEKQKNMIKNLQEDFNKINKNNNDLNKYNEKLIKENQQLKRELFLKTNEIENLNNKNINEIKENNDILLKEKKELLNDLKNIENKNMELIEIKDNQKIEIDSLNNIINNKNNELVNYLKEIENLKNNNIYNVINNNSNEKLSSEINLDLIINNIQNELKEKNKLIEDLKTQNSNLIKENDYKENIIREYLEKENIKKVDINNYDKKYKDEIERLNTIIKQKELEIYSFKNNEKSYNKIVDLSFQSIQEFINKIKNYDEFKENQKLYLDNDINENNSENNLFTTSLKEFMNKMEEEKKSINNYYNGNNIPLIEKIKKINIFTNIIPYEIDNLYNKIKEIQQENKILVDVKSGTKIINTINDDEEINNNNNSQSSPSIIDTNNNKFDILGYLKKNISNHNNTNNNYSIFMDNNEVKIINSINQQKKNSTRNNILSINNNPSENNIFKNIFEEKNTPYKGNSNSLNNKEKITTAESKGISLGSNSRSDKINSKVKEINNYIYNSEVPKSFLLDEEKNINNNYKEKKDLENNIPYNNKTFKKSRLTLFKEEMSNKINGNNRNTLLPYQINHLEDTKEENEKIFYKKNSQNNFKFNINNISQISLKSNNSISNNINFLNNDINNIKNIDISQPNTNRSNISYISKINSKNNKRNYNRNENKNFFEELNISSNSKNILNSKTIESSRFNNNIVPSIKDNTFFNKNKKSEDKIKKDELYKKSINGLADEVMKPSFLKSDVSMTMLSGLNSDNNKSFLFLARNKLKKKIIKNDNYNFINIKSNNDRKYSPFNNNNTNIKNKDNRNDKNDKKDLHRNRSFLY